MKVIMYAYFILFKNLLNLLTLKIIMIKYYRLTIKVLMVPALVWLIISSKLLKFPGSVRFQ